MQDVLQFTNDLTEFYNSLENQNLDNSSLSFEQQARDGNFLDDLALQNFLEEQHRRI